MELNKFLMDHKAAIGAVSFGMLLLMSIYLIYDYENAFSQDTIYKLSNGESCIERYYGETLLKGNCTEFKVRMEYEKSLKYNFTFANEQT